MALAMTGSLVLRFGRSDAPQFGHRFRESRDGLYAD